MIISGFSGAGKGTIIKEMLQRYDNYALSISATTRGPREGEIEGVSYFFKSKEEFEQMIEENQFIEYAQYVDNYYGTPRAYVEQQMAAGKNVILEIELQGALKVQKQYKDALLLFITPPTAKELEERLVGRGTEATEIISKRMSRAFEESYYMKNYDYIVVNEEVVKCAETIHNIVLAEQSRSIRNQEFIDQIETQLRVYSKGEE